MTIKTKQWKFNNNTITFLLINSKWLVPAKLIGRALGYSNDGQKLGDHLSNWSKNWTAEDFKNISGAELKTLRNQNPELGVSLSANSVMFLTPSGVAKVLQRSRAGLALEFRNFLSKEASFLFKNYLEAAPKQMPLGLPEKPQEGVSHLSEVLQILEVGAKQGLMTKGERKLALSRILDVKMQALTKENKVTHFFSPDGTVDPTKLPALSQNALAVPEGSVTLIERGQRHPDFKDWESATDIGNRYGLKHELVKKYIKAFVIGKGTDLPNNLADVFVEQNGGKFPPTDKHGFIVFSAETAETSGGIAIYSKIDGNKLVWRNYWSPSSVKAICRLLEQDRGIEPLTPTQKVATEVIIDVKATETVKEEVKGLEPSSHLSEELHGQNCQ